MRKLSLDKEVYQVPENFSECKPEVIGKVLLLQTVIQRAEEVSEDLDLTPYKLSVLFLLIPVNKKTFKKLTADQKVQLMNLIRWAFTARVENKPFDYFTENGVEYYLPAPNYEDTTAIEWALLSIYYIAYTNQNMPADLRGQYFYKITALLCRPMRSDFKEFKADPERYNADVREKFNGVLAEEREAVFKKMELGKLIAVFQYWEHTNKNFVERNKELFESGGDSDSIFKNGEGCLSLLADIAEEGVMGKLDEVYQVSTPELFMYLRQKQKKMQKAEREVEKLTKKNK